MVYVISDIHGNQKAFFNMLKKINFTSEDKLYILGDVIDRGPNGIELLQYIMKQPNITMLMGNHEYMMLSAIKHFSYSNLRLWERKGGTITRTQYEALSKEEQDEIIDFIANLQINVEEEVNSIKYLLVHASPLPVQYGNTFNDYHIYEYYTDTEYAVWNRSIYAKLPDKTIIFGHTPTFHYKNYPKPRVLYFKDTDSYNIDCGAAYPQYTGRLACMRLNDKKIFYVDIDKKVDAMDGY